MVVLHQPNISQSVPHNKISSTLRKSHFTTSIFLFKHRTNYHPSGWSCTGWWVDHDVVSFFSWTQFCNVTDFAFRLSLLFDLHKALNQKNQNVSSCHQTFLHDVFLNGSSSSLRFGEKNWFAQRTSNTFNLLKGEILRNNFMASVVKSKKLPRACSGSVSITWPCKTCLEKHEERENVHVEFSYYGMGYYDSQEIM